MRTAFTSNKSNYPLSSSTTRNTDVRYGRTDTFVVTDTPSSWSGGGHDFSDWYSGRGSATPTKSARGYDDDDDETDDTVSVGCESPLYAIASARTAPKKKSSSDSEAGLKFSIDNILRAEFGGGEAMRRRGVKKDAAGQRRWQWRRPVDLTQAGGGRATKLKTERRDKGWRNVADHWPDNNLWPAWIYCTRYTDRPSSGRSPRMRIKRKEKRPEVKRPRTAFTGEQLGRLKKEFNENNYLTEKRRQELATELGLHETQIKIWFQNKRAKIKKASGTKNPLALQLMAEGLYNHSTLQAGKDEKES